MAIIMPMYDKEERFLVPEGDYESVVYSWVDLGTVASMGDYEDSRQFQLGFEIPSLRMTKDEKDVPQCFWQRYYFPRKLEKGFGPKSTYRKHLEGWKRSITGEGFTKEEMVGYDITKPLGRSCVITIEHYFNEWVKADRARIYRIRKHPKGLQYLKPENDVMFFALPPFADMDIPNNLYDWMKRVIRDSNEWAERMGDTDPDLPPPDTTDMPEPDDDVPF
jgi:hypothetical protein